MALVKQEAANDKKKTAASQNKPANSGSDKPIVNTNVDTSNLAGVNYQQAAGTPRKNEAGKVFVPEVSVPENSVFTKPEKEEDRIREYNIPCCEGDTTADSTTAIIDDKGTRVVFEKRDSKYGYLIPDETTTFQVYQCKKGEECHPGDGITSDMKLMK